MVTLHSRDKNSNLYAGLENPPQVCHPEPLIPPGTESSSDRVLKHFVDPEECEDARLEVRHSHLFGCCSSWDENILFENKNSIFNLTLLGHYDVSLLNLSVRVWKIFCSVISATSFLTWQEDSSLYNTSDTARLCRWTSCRSYSQPGWSESADRTSWSDGTTLSYNIIHVYFL